MELLDFLRTHEEAFRSRARLASLYSDFRLQRTANPDGYQANSAAWLRALCAATQAGLIPSPSQASTNDRYVLNSGDDLASALQTKELGRPLALGAVLSDAVKKKELVLLKDFLNKKESLYARESWIPTPWQIATWGLEKLGLVGGEASEDRLVKGQFVVVANVEAAAKAVLDHSSAISTSNSSKIFSRDLFSTTFASALGQDSLSPNDLSVLLTHLSRDRSAMSYTPDSGVIKFKSPSEAQPTMITEEDISIASIRTLISSLEPQITLLNSRVSELDRAARTAVSNKQLIAAKTALRQKKAAETKLQQRLATLTQLEDVYGKIEQAADQVEIVRVMSAAGQTLKSLNKQTGGVEKVQDVMDGLREEMMNVDEIGQAMNEISAGEIDEGEVDDELEAMERVEREKKEAVEKTEREKKDAAEKDERERREAEEVEKTRLRLAGLEKPKKDLQPVKSDEQESKELQPESANA